MAAHHGRGLAGGGEAFERVGACRLEQPIADLAVAGVGGDERLVAQAGQALDDRELVVVIVGGHRRRGAELERRGEDAEPPQHALLGRRQQAMAPVQRRLQRALPRQRGTPSGGEQPEALVQPRGQRVDAEQRHARGGHLQRQRDAVQAPADRRHRRRIAVVEHEPRLGRLRAGDEELHRAADQRLLRGRVRLRRDAERRQAEDLLAGDADQLLRADQRADVRRRRQHRLQQRGNGVDEVLGVVEHEQQRRAAEPVRQRRQRRLCRRDLDAERGRDGRRQQHLVGQRREFEHPHAVGVAADGGPGGVEDEPRLADATRPGHRDEPVRFEQRLQVVLLDDEPRPDEVHQLALGDDAIVPFGERKQHVERAPAEPGRHAVGQQHALARPQLVAAEAPGRGR